MKSNTLILSLVLVVTVAGVGWLILTRESRAPEAAPAAAPVETEPARPAPTPKPIEPEIPAAPTAAEAAEEETVTMDDLPPTSFALTLIAKKWMEEEGYTLAELAEAEQKARDAGLSQELINYGEVRRFLPPRYMNSVQIDTVSVPKTVKAGEPIPFTVRGRTPGEGFEFLRFNTVVQGPIVRINPLGFTREPTEGAMTAPVTLEGTLDPLPPGEYKFFVPELGPNGTFPFTVEE